MPNRPPLADLTAAELRELARRSRVPAETASTAPARDELIWLAEKLEALAAQREAVGSRHATRRLHVAQDQARWLLEPDRALGNCSSEEQLEHDLKA
jgi:hypothetical protein